MAEGDGAPLRRLGADQRVRYLLVGTTNTMIGYTAFAVFDLTVLAAVPNGHVLSLLAAYAISIVIAFVLYRRFVFHVSGQVLRDFVAFVSVNLFSIGLNLVLLLVLVNIADLPALGAQALALFVTVVVGYLGHREVSFKR